MKEIYVLARHVGMSYESICSLTPEERYQLLHNLNDEFKDKKDVDPSTVPRRNLPPI